MSLLDRDKPKKLGKIKLETLSTDSPPEVQ